MDSTPIDGVSGYVGGWVGGCKQEQKDVNT